MDYTNKLNTLRRYVESWDTFCENRAAFKTISGGMVKEWREIGGLSLRKLAEALKVSPSFLSKVENGIEALPPEVARRILEMHK